MPTRVAVELRIELLQNLIRAVFAWSSAGLGLAAYLAWLIHLLAESFCGEAFADSQIATFSVALASLGSAVTFLALRGVTRVIAGDFSMCAIRYAIGSVLGFGLAGAATWIIVGVFVVDMWLPVGEKGVALVGASAIGGILGMPLGGGLMLMERKDAPDAEGGARQEGR